MSSSDEDDEEEEENADPNGDAVKEDPDRPRKGKARARTPSDELHVYSVEELSVFRKRELIADAELLDGNIALPNGIPCADLTLMSSREAQELQARPQRAEGLPEA